MLQSKNKAIARPFLDRDTDHLAQPTHGHGQTQAQGNGQPLSVHRGLCLAGEIFQPGRLSQTAFCGKSDRAGEVAKHGF